MFWKCSPRFVCSPQVQFSIKSRERKEEIGKDRWKVNSELHYWQRQTEFLKWVGIDYKNVLFVRFIRQKPSNSTADYERIKLNSSLANIWIWLRLMHTQSLTMLLNAQSEFEMKRNWSSRRLLFMFGFR